MRSQLRRYTPSSALFLSLTVLSACSEQDVAELGVYTGQQNEGEPVLGDSSTAIPSICPPPGAVLPGPGLTLGDSGNNQVPPQLYPYCTAENNLGDGGCQHAPSGSAEIPPTLPGGTTCHRLVAHAAGSSMGYIVAVGGREYVRYTFNAPWTGKQFVRSIRFLYDWPSTAHHWNLYAEPRLLSEGVEVATSAKQTGSLVYGWTPGATPLNLSSELGIPVTDDVSYTLEVKYDNSFNDPYEDHTGVELCASPRPALYAVSLTQLEEL